MPALDVLVDQHHPLAVIEGREQLLVVTSAGEEPVTQPPCPPPAPDLREYGPRVRPPRGTER